MNADAYKANRRKFILAGLAGAGLVGGSVAGLTWGWRLTERKAYPGKNPYAYDLSNYEKTDPSLLKYEETSRWNVPRPAPRRLAIGPGDEVYVTAGNYVSTLDGAGKVRRELALSGPAGCITVGKDGRLFAGLRDHVEVFDAEGKSSAKWEPVGGKPWLTGLALNGEELFVADAGNRLVHRYDLNGKPVGEIGERATAETGFVVPSPNFDVEWHSEGWLLVTNPGRHRVETYTAAGELDFSWGKFSARIDGFCGCCNPVGLALLSDGSVITCEKGLPRVKVYTFQGELESVVAGPESFPENVGVCLDSDMDCHVGGMDVAVDSQDRIHILDLVGCTVRTMQRASV